VALLPRDGEHTQARAGATAPLHPPATLMGIPDVPRATAPAARGSAVAKRGPGRIGYEDAELIGFEHVPAALARELWSSGVLFGSMWVGTAERPVARRRASDGSHYQQLHAWWASEWRYAEFDAGRELAVVGDGRLRPEGPWNARGTFYDYPQAVAGIRSIWRFQAPETGGTRNPPSRRTNNPLEVLPPPVASPIMGGKSDSWREYGKGWATETIVASKVSGSRVLLLRANREASSRRALDSADWMVETIDTPTTRATPFSVAVPYAETGPGLDAPTPELQRRPGTEAASKPVDQSLGWDQYHRRVCVVCGTKTRWRDDQGQALCPTCNPAS